jgi:hypothetical protein
VIGILQLIKVVVLMRIVIIFIQMNRLTEISATAPLKMAAIKTTAILMIAIAYLPIKTIVVTRDPPTIFRQ